MPHEDADALAPGPVETGGDFSWPLLDRVPARLAEEGHVAEAYAAVLRDGQADLKARFLAEEPVETLVHARARLLDAVLREIWASRLDGHQDEWTLVAVGGYGRGELHPCSDVDILVLVPAPQQPDGLRSLERLVTFL